MHTATVMVTPTFWYGWFKSISLLMYCPTYLITLINKAEVVMAICERIQSTQLRNHRIIRKGRKADYHGARHLGSTEARNYNKDERGLEEAQGGSALATKPDYLSLNPRTHIVEGESQLLQVELNLHR